MLSKLKSWTGWHSALVLAIPVILIAGLSVDKGEHVVRFWIIAIASLLAMIWLAGVGITGQHLGLLIDKRNKMSLSRLQATLWTVLVLATLITAVFYNLNVLDADQAADVAIPAEILGLLGLSATALVGSPILLSARDQKTVVKKPERMKTAVASSMVRDAAEAGTDLPPVHKNPASKDASVSDLFKGDEVDNFEYLDLAKVQNFLFNLIVIAVYGGMIYSMLVVLDKHAIDFAEDTVRQAADALAAARVSLDEAAKEAAAAADSLSAAKKIGGEAGIRLAEVAVATSDDLFMAAQATLENAEAQYSSIRSKYALAVFPEISGGLLAMLGISTGGYLANKGVAHTPTES